MIRKRWIIALGLSWLLAATIGYVVAQSSLSSIYIMGGVYPGSVTYTVWIEGSTYYAKDQNGQIDYSGTNASAVVQSVLDIMYLTIDYSGDVDYAMMGYILFQKGTYLFDTQLLLEHEIGDGWAGGLIMSGEGRYTTALKAIGAHPIFNFTAASRDDRFEAITICGMEFVSDSAAQSVGNHALIFTNATFVNIHDCYFEANYDSAIYMNGLETNFITNNGIYGNRGNGIDLVQCSDTHIEGNNIAENDGDGISVNGAVYNSIVGNTIIYSGNDGIDLYASQKCQVSSNSIGISNATGIRINLCGNITIADNTVFANGLGGVGLGDGILIGNSNYTSVSGNRVFDDSSPQIQRYGIREEGTSDYNIITGCSTIGCASDADQAPISILTASGSSNTRVVNCYNGTTWVATWGTG